MARVQNIAHRGFSGKYPENTNIAFAKALTEGYCDGIEVDIHMTKDNKLVIIHDDKLDRTTTGTGYIKDHTLEELTPFDAGIKYDEKYKGEKILCIKSAMELAKKFQVKLYIEIKDSVIPYKNIEEEVLDRIETVDVADRVVVSASNIDTLRLIKEKMPQVQTALIVKDMTWDIRDYRYADAISCEYTKLTAEAVDTIHSIGKKVIAWIVDDVQAMKEVKLLNVDSVITNYPNKFNDVINGLA